MQITLLEENYEKYEKDGKKYNFPDAPKQCPICKKHVQMKKHGFYLRYFVIVGFNKKIMIRRYICPECGKTISFLPYFCITFFQYYIGLIIEYIKETINRTDTLKSCLERLRKANPDIYIERQHVYFYTKRFMNNIIHIQHGLRLIIPSISFLEKETDKKRRVRELIEIISNGFESTHVFAKRFRDNCNKACLASLNLF